LIFEAVYISQASAVIVIIIKLRHQISGQSHKL